MRKQELRFSVTDGNGNRAATWKVFSNKSKASSRDDVYLLCRELRSKIKISLHQSESWHAGFDRRFLEQYPLDGSLKSNPYIDIWSRPPEIAPGVTLAYRIIVPTAGVNVPINRKNRDSKSIVWIPAAPIGKAVEIAILFSKPTANVVGWPGARAMNTKLAGTLTLDCSETVWVVHRIDEVPSIPPKSGKGQRFRSCSDLKSTKRSARYPRAITFGTHEDGSRFMIDSAVDAPVVEAGIDMWIC